MIWHTIMYLHMHTHIHIHIHTHTRELCQNCPNLARWAMSKLSQPCPVSYVKIVPGMLLSGGCMRAMSQLRCSPLLEVYVGYVCITYQSKPCWWVIDLVVARVASNSSNTNGSHDCRGLSNSAEVPLASRSNTICGSSKAMPSLAVVATSTKMRVLPTVASSSSS